MMTILFHNQRYNFVLRSKNWDIFTCEDFKEFVGSIQIDNIYYHVTEDSFFKVIEKITISRIFKNDFAICYRLKRG